MSGKLRSALTGGLLLALSCGGAAGQPLQPEQLTTDISSHEISIETNFNGIRVVIFGAVDYSRQPSASSGVYDVAIALRGPDENLMARRKERIAGLWMNSGAIAFRGAPSFYAALSTRPLNEIAEDGALLKYGLGFDSLVFVPDYADVAHTGESFDAFRTAVIAEKQKQKLYLEAPFSVGFIGRSLFRGTVELPVNVPIGEFTADVFLFRDGKLLSSHQSKFVVGKAGIGQFVFENAFTRPILYGVAAVVIAFAWGLAASALARRT